MPNNHIKTSSMVISCDPKRLLFLTMVFSVYNFVHVSNNLSGVKVSRTLTGDDVSHFTSMEALYQRSSSRLQPPMPQAGLSSPPCSPTEVEEMRRQLPHPRDIREATRCPIHTWLDDFLYDAAVDPHLHDVKLRYRRQGGKDPEYSDREPGYRHLDYRDRPLISVHLGCNKGDDAVRMLRKLTGWTNAIELPQYYRTLQDAVDNPTWFARWTRTPTRQKLMRRACAAKEQSVATNHTLDDHPIMVHHPWATTSNDRLLDQSTTTRSAGRPPQPAMAFCIEAHPPLAEHVENAVSRYGWSSQFRVVPAAVGRTDGTSYFQTRSLAGEERHSVVHCENSADQANGIMPENCAPVPRYNLDTLVQQHILPKIPSQQRGSFLRRPPPIEKDNFVIDVLQVDVEGNDWEVLGSADAVWTLARVRYLEFEYHHIGNWRHANLSQAVTTLHSYGFVCYYAGTSKLWRLTGCFQDYMDHHTLSNVACVNAQLNPILATRMDQEARALLSARTGTS